MISVYEFSDYREFIKAWIATHDKTSRGLKTELAQIMGMSSSLMSQILKGDKSLSLEQAGEAAERFAFTELETDYWFFLVEKDRAGTPKLRARFEKKMKLARDQARSLSKRSKKDTELSEETKTTYYSSWIYSGAHILSALPNVTDTPQIAKMLNLPPSIVSKVVQFLLENGLCRWDKGQLTYGAAHIFSEKESPHTQKHESNWRLQALAAAAKKREEDLFFTCPMSLSHETAAEIRRWIPQIIQEVYKKVGPSPSERVACLNIDWFDYADSDLRPVSGEGTED